MLMKLSGLILTVVWFHFIVFISVCCSSVLHPGYPSTTSKVLGNETDLLALLAFRAKITKDPLRVMSSWNESIHFCQWHGVTCGRHHQRVTTLDLQSQQLVGSITPHVGNLSFLRELSLQNNSFIHIIPLELGGLRRLKYLRLYDNSISGIIPANLSGCSDLIVLDFDNNRLLGELPSELGFLSKLEALYINNNILTGGIPPPLGNLSSLQEISISDNNFSGRIPDSLSQLTSLATFSMSGNKLSGEIPLSIFNLSSMTGFDVSFNQIHGVLPSNLGITLSDLQFLSISQNQFTGPIPLSLSNSTNLLELAFSINRFTGKVPNLGNSHRLRSLSISMNLLGNGESDDLSFLSSLNNATGLNELALGGNHFGGMLPESISNLSTMLNVLSLADNYIFGSIRGLCNLVNLERLNLWGNQFTGIIHTDFGKLRALRILDLSDNKLSGNIPLSVGNLSLLTKLYLQENNLEGRIPASLGKCKNLLSLVLFNNNLSGIIPREVVAISSLSIGLSLSQNHLIGSLPMDVENLKNLGYLDVSKNMLSGEIPHTLGSCLSLQVLYMDNNFFRGNIPSSIDSLKGMRFLDLSANNLSGKIPEYLRVIDLQYLNLSFNDFKGEIPTEGIFKNASATFLTGNSELCGGIPELRFPRCQIQVSKKSKFKRSLKIIIFVISGTVGLSLVLCFLYSCWFRKAKKESSSDLPEYSLLRVSYQDLLKTTDGFSSANLIGTGSFGSVYRGIIGHDGTVVAVKVLNLFHHGASKSFIAECEAMKNIRHRNLVKVLTACSGIDYQGNEFKALIYEFMVNGSLEEWLHPNLIEDMAQNIPKKLNFLQRLNIAIDVASALDYLHHNCGTPIIHCDLKPSNVLLDSEMIGHVGDFGLAKFIENMNKNPYHTSSIGIRGSIGYTAPEYGVGSEVSLEGDMYSFGILLLEIFTGKRPTDDMFQDGFNLHKFSKAALPERVAAVLDPVLLEEIEEVEAGTNSIHDRSFIKKHDIRECVISVLGIGVVCSEELARERMNTKDVAVELLSIRNSFLGIGRIKIT